MTPEIEESSGSPFFIDNKGGDMSEDREIAITKDGDEATGLMTTKVFELDTEKETVHFWRSTYTWNQVLKIADWIKEERELHAEPEEAPF
tara:strand:- start:193 stop:462 length:270 start_codon:yes stop_codon:yes gene_type:complete